MAEVEARAEVVDLGAVGILAVGRWTVQPEADEEVELVQELRCSAAVPASSKPSASSDRAPRD